MDLFKLLPAPDYTAQERESLIDFVLALRKSHIKDLLKSAELPMAGTKPELRSKLEKALKKGQLKHERVVEFLDVVAPWGKQHVFLYGGPRGDLQNWKNASYVHGLLKDHRLGKLFNAQLPLILPEKLSLSSVRHSSGKLRITAIQKREYPERASEYDQEMRKGDKRVTLTAHVHHLTRTLVAFDWDLNANVAMLQITQLRSDGDYEKVAEEFFQLIGSWLDIKRFGSVDLHKAISKLDELEGKGKGHAETSSHKIEFRTLRGRGLAAHSPSRRDSVRGEAHIDRAMDEARKNGVGHLGNFYWLPKVNPGAVTNPLQEKVHVIIVAAKSRVNFPKPNPEEVVRYVLYRVRELS